MKSDTGVQAVERRLDPRTEELLREIASSGDSCLLRASRRELGDALGRADYRGLATQVGFSSAERELLRTARAEVAYWLNVICFRRLTEDEATGRYCTRLVEGGGEYVPPDLESTRAGLRDARASARELSAVDAPMEDVLERLVAGEFDLSADVRDIAAASLRLHPTFQARHYAVQAEVWTAPSDFTFRAAERILSTARGAGDRAYVSGLLGTLHWLNDRPDRALAAYAGAFESLPSHPEFAARALVMSIYAGECDTAETWIARLRSMSINSRRAVVAVARSVERSMQVRGVAARAASRRVRSSSGSVAQEIFDAYERA